jgi:3-deoxy-D-manno-octulosonic acid kinase
MTKYGGQRIATADGAMLADPASLGSFAGNFVDDALEAAVELESAFEPAFWAARDELIEVTRGRGSAWFVSERGRWVLRHYRRGGWIARLSRDRYIWAGEARVRAFAEFRLLAELVRGGLPVPKPVAARYRRRGPFYRCDLITQRIAGARPLSSVLSREPVSEDLWREVGAAVARLHAAGADHPDLNAHNILVGDGGAVSVIDFDRGVLRNPAAKSGGWVPAGPRGWSAKNLSRLHRSLVKVSRDLPPDRFSAAAWDRLLAGYRLRAGYG